MYRFLDRPAAALDEPHRFLLAAMRGWVAAARRGRCPCRALLRGFVTRGVPDAAGDFGMAMAALDRDGLSRFVFAPGRDAVRSDEARLLALFDAGLAGRPPRVRRIAATLVCEEAAPRLATAVERVALHLTDGTFLERDR